MSAIVVTLSISETSTTELCFQEPGKTFGIVRTDSQHALLQMDDDAIPAPEITHPAASDAQVNSPAVENQGSSDFDTLSMSAYRTVLRKKGTGPKRIISLSPKSTTVR